MRRVAAALATAVCLAMTGTAMAQFQTCNYCDVQPFNPDPFDVDACDVGSIILRGAGFQTTGTNGCSTTPVVAVRSTRPDRLVIVSFQVLGDGRIQVDYQVPCSASSGIVGIDVTIDDNPADAIAPYACGNARMMVHDRPLAVSFGSIGAAATGAGVEVRWTTLSESGTLGFTVWSRGADGREVALDRLVEAGSPQRAYRLLDDRAEARAGRTVAYRVVELRDDGRAGDATEWVGVTVETPPQLGGRGRAARRWR